MRELLVVLFCLSAELLAAQAQQTFRIIANDQGHRVAVTHEGKDLVLSPEEGLWSIGQGWRGDWPISWAHAKAEEIEEVDDWRILRGKLLLDNGELHFQDAYRNQNGLVKCLRRFEWKGDEALDSVTLSIRWQVTAREPEALLPGILYYGNPSGEKNGSHKVPTYHGLPSELAIFEEHRYPMPFASLEWARDEQHWGAALHSLPSPVNGGNKDDQWWSLGVQTDDVWTELVLLSGPVGYNNEKGVVKALQSKALRYSDTFLRMEPGDVVEKTFFLEAYPVSEKGSGFQQPTLSSIDLFKPFYTEDLPTVDEIIQSKYRFAKSRWIEGQGYAGFNMYPDFAKQRIVLGWAGQSEAPIYALQVLAPRLKDANIWNMVQKAMDHITTSPVSDSGFPVRYEVETGEWHSPDPVSEGQALNNIALAIKVARTHKRLEIGGWESFLNEAIGVHAKRILSQEWHPRNTAEAFYISPLLLSASLFDNVEYRKAALKAADYYGERHIDMEEPYWGGTLDATCEDKEGAWGAFQGFLAAYELTQQEKYLSWAQHAGDVVLTYTVVWDIPLPAGRMSDHFFKTRGWTGVSPQNQHLDVYGVLIAPSIYKLGELTGNDDLKKLAKVMYRSCGQMIDPYGAHGEQLQQTNFAQHGKMSDVYALRGGYSESWTVFWITAHFLHAAAQFEEMGVRF